MRETRDKVLQRSSTSLSHFDKVRAMVASFAASSTADRNAPAMGSASKLLE
jgi:hypothetical protein